MRLIDDRTGLEVIDREECLLLLARGGLGRVAVAAHGSRPTILPVNYVTDGDAIVFRTAAGSKLTAVTRGRHVAFEIDGSDPFARTGWSVVVTGKAEEVTDAGEVERMRRLPLAPWADGDKPHWIRLPIERVTGRRVVHTAGRDRS